MTKQTIVSGPLKLISPDIIIALTLAVIMLVAFIQTLSWPSAAAMFPRVVALCGLGFAIALGVILIARRVRAGAADGHPGAQIFGSRSSRSAGRSGTGRRRIHLRDCGQERLETGPRMGGAVSGAHDRAGALRLQRDLRPALPQMGSRQAMAFFHYLRNYSFHIPAGHVPVDSLHSDTGGHAHRLVSAGM